MEKNTFFDLSSRFVSSTVHVRALGLKVGKNGLNDRSNLIKGNYEGINFPVIFKHDSGKKFTDILDTGWPSLMIISERMKTILEENQLTGWKVFPIKLYDKKENEIFGYHGFSITGKCDRTDYKKSPIIEKRYVPTGPICKILKGRVIEGWDGSDFFTPEGTYFIFITQKTANILEKNKITNMRIIDVCDMEIDFFSVKDKI